MVIIVSAFTYLSRSRANIANFSEPMDHMGALYFTITVLGSRRNNGFGGV